MAKQSRMRLNRDAFAGPKLAVADGLFALAERIVAGAHPPDAPALGIGLVEGGGAIAFVDARKVADSTIGGRAIKKPRASRPPRDGAYAVGGFGFPGRFVELGTVHSAPEPFLRPSFDAEAGSAVETVTAAAAASYRGQP